MRVEKGVYYYDRMVQNTMRLYKIFRIAEALISFKQPFKNVLLNVYKRSRQFRYTL